MYVIYQPEGGDLQTWEFDPARVRSQRAIQIEKHAGKTWEEWLAAVQTGQMRARRVLLWHLTSTDHPTLRWEDTPDFYAGELEVHHSPDELREMIRQAKKASHTIPEDQYTIAMAALERELGEAIALHRKHFAPAVDAEPEAGEPEPEEAEGKARRRSASGGTATGGR